MTQRNKSEWLERQAVTILDKEVFDKFISECKLNKVGKSELAHSKIVEYYNNKSVQERMNLQRLWDEMTPEQRLNPKGK